MKKNYIEYDVAGALDFSCSIKIHLSETLKEGYTEIDSYDLFCRLLFPCMYYIIQNEFERILGYRHYYCDHVRKPKKIIYYRCERENEHSHEMLAFRKLPPHITEMTLDDAIKLIKEENGFQIKV